MKVSVVIPNINGKQIMEKNLPKLIQAAKLKDNNISEIIVVDDGSWDDSVKYIGTHYKDQIKLIKHKQNRGFSAAVNTGVRAAKGSLILLLNTDVIPEVDFLKKVFNHFTDPKIFAVSCHEYGYGPAVGYFDQGYIQLGMGKELNRVQNTFYVSGGSGIFRKSIWKELGGMDEKLLSPFYWEDIDICYRALKRGYKCLWDPTARVTHVHESTISKFPKKYVDRVKERNRLLMIWKNLHSWPLLKKHLFEVLMRVLKHPGYLIPTLMAIGRLNVAIVSRKQEIKDSVISDEIIFNEFKR